MKTYLFTLSLLCLYATASAQYLGGGGKGASAYTANALSFNAGSMYSGGIDDGHGRTASPALTLSTNSSFAGGPNDGAAAVSVNSVSLAAADMYSGGTDDGSGFASNPSLAMGAVSSYAGGADDGASGILRPAVSLGASTMYSGGSNDGASGIAAGVLSVTPLGSMYPGGGNDGFSMVSAAAQPIVALPITWEDFSVSRHGTDAYLYWQVGNERNDAAFEVERSFDGAAFSRIATVQAKAGISNLNDYNYTDHEPAEACPAPASCAAYYRLRQKDPAGHFSFSPIRKLALDAPSLQASVYPNPTRDRIIIRINAAGGNAPLYSFTLYNNIGVALSSRSLLAEPTTEIDVRSFPSGNYYLRLSIADHTYPYQITITH